MNALQDPAMINRLYNASEHGVQIDLIVRGICCLIPGQSYSRNIRVTRIVDSFLEHARIWYFGNNHHPKVFMGSPDWMRRNSYRRVSKQSPDTRPRPACQPDRNAEHPTGRQPKACWVDAQLQNVFKRKRTPGTPSVRAQYNFYEQLKNSLLPHNPT
ncbi:hypothetical protein NXV38_21730 [Bacteroides caccae]|nr:hypothetical protein [Bacteroides caccae]